LRVVETARPPPSLEYVLAYSTVGLETGGRLVADIAKALIAQKPDLQAYYSAIGIETDNVILSFNEKIAEFDKTT
jgi:hypothetical protein